MVRVDCAANDNYNATQNTVLTLIKICIKVGLSRARTHPTRTRTRTQLLSSFAIQIEDEPECRKLLTAFEAAGLFLAVRDKIWSFGIMAQVESDMEEIIALYAKQRRKTKRCVSVHEILQRRSKFGEFHHLVQELHFHLQNSSNTSILQNSSNTFE